MEDRRNKKCYLHGVLELFLIKTSLFEPGFVGGGARLFISAAWVA